MKKKTFAKLLFAVPLIALGFFIYSFFPFNINVTERASAPDMALGADIPRPVASFQTSLATGISATDTTMSLVSLTTDDGVTLTDGAVYGFTIDEGSAAEEYVVGTVETSNNTVISMTRGLSVITGNTSIAALKKAHRRGAAVKVTDHPTLTVVSRIVNGLETLPAALTYTSGVGPVSDGDLTDKEYVLSVVNGGPISYNKVIVSGVAGETVAAGNLVYHSTSDGQWYKTDADTVATVEAVQLGIAQGSGTLGNAISGGVLIKGVDSNNTGTAGVLAYASNTAGSIASSAGTVSKVVGQYIISSGGLYFDPNFYYTISANTKAAVAGGGAFGTPSSTNKFITQDYNASSTGLPVIRTYTSNDTWTKPSGLKYVVVEVVGGGGGGAGSNEGTNDQAGNGGGGGGYSKEILVASSLSSSESVTVGAGGAGGAAANDGATGGTSSFGSFLQATGGTGGQYPGGQDDVGKGGIGSGGSLNAAGDTGGYTYKSGSSESAGGNGGGSFMGGGGRGGNQSVARDPEVGQAYGGGGGGRNGETDDAGAAGAAGVVIVTEYYN